MPSFIAALAHDDVGDGTIPHEIRRTRRYILDYHNTLGQPVLFKHAWTEDDVASGKAVYCPFCRDTAYQQGRSADPNCYGTGYLGGFDTGILVWMALADAVEDTFRLNSEGILYRDQHPMSSAPWQPIIRDGDLLISVAVDPANLNTVLSTGDRYLAKEVTKINPRGVFRGADIRQRRPNHIVQQNLMMDRLEESHPFYAVTNEFDYAHLPPPPDLPLGSDTPIGGLAVPVGVIDGVISGLIAGHGHNHPVTFTFEAE